jgi:hypothetical protein
VLKEFGSQYNLQRVKKGLRERTEEELKMMRTAVVSMIGHMCAQNRYYAIGGRPPNSRGVGAAPSWAHFLFGQKNQYDLVVYDCEELFIADKFMEVVCS